MRNNRKNSFGILLFAALAMAAVSCKKETSANDAQNSADIQAAVAATQAVAVATTTAGGTDSVYIINTCGQHQHRDSVAISALPTSIGTYLSTNYSGFTGERAFAIK